MMFADNFTRISKMVLVSTFPFIIWNSSHSYQELSEEVQGGLFAPIRFKEDEDVKVVKPSNGLFCKNIEMEVEKYQ